MQRHLDETWADVGPNSGWLGGTGELWERGPYVSRRPLCRWPTYWTTQLEGKRSVTTSNLYYQAPSGMIGPASNDDWWPRIVMLKALTQYHEFTGDPRVIPVMDKYFKYQIAFCRLVPCIRQVPLAGRVSERDLAV